MGVISFDKGTIITTMTIFGLIIILIGFLICIIMRKNGQCCRKQSPKSPPQSISSNLPKSSRSDRKKSVYKSKKSKLTQIKSTSNREIVDSASKSKSKSKSKSSMEKDCNRDDTIIVVRPKVILNAK